MEHTEYVDLGRFETYIRYHFHDKHILLEALSHSSYANEKRKTRKCNERLEFLGDSVLSIVVSDFLFRKYPELPEGDKMREISDFSPDKVNGAYAKSKAAATAAVLAAAEKGLNASVVHPSGIIGPGDEKCGNITRLISAFIRGRLPFAVKGGYDFVDVRDVAKGIFLCTERGKRGKCYILSGHYATVSDILKTVRDLAGLKRVVSCVLHFWGTLFYFEKGSDVLGILSSYTVWVKEPEWSGCLTADIGADIRNEDKTYCQQAFTGINYIITDQPRLIIGHNVGPKEYDEVMDSAKVCELIGLK